MAKKQKVKQKTTKPKKATPPRIAPKPRRPRQERLLDDMPRDAIMSRLSLSQHDALIDANEARRIMDQNRAQAAERMQTIKRSHYIEHGVEWSYIPGGAKVRCRLTDVDTDDDAPQDDADAPADRGVEAE